MITITIKTDNAAFGDNSRERAAEVARILRTLADQVESDAMMMKSPRDVNGNHCGNVIATGKDRGFA